VSTEGVAYDLRSAPSAADVIAFDLDSSGISMETVCSLNTVAHPIVCFTLYVLQVLAVLDLRSAALRAPIVTADAFHFADRMAPFIQNILVINTLHLLCSFTFPSLCALSMGAVRPALARVM
jgi:hypothetical protein